MSKYVSQFLSLKCVGDVLNNVLPINKPTKEITEAMAIVQRMKGVFLSNPMKYRLFDVGAGNALGSILSIHLLPVSWATAIDKKPIERKRKISRFDYLKAEIGTEEGNEYIKSLWPSLNKDSLTVLMSIHCCTDLALQVISLYHETEWIKHLYLMPCCIKQGHQQPVPTAFQDRFTKYERWAWFLANEVHGTLYQDKHCLSPANIIIEAHKGE